jgi:hypothetical protein
MTAERQVRVTSHIRDGHQVRGYTREQDAAKEKWDTRKWQAATAGASVLIILAEVIVGVSEIAFAITLLILVGLNWLIHAVTNPKPKPATRRPPARRRTVRRTPTRRRVVRR